MLFVQTSDRQCVYDTGCTDSAATNFDPAAVRDDGSCRYSLNTLKAHLGEFLLFLLVVADNHGAIMDFSVSATEAALRRSHSFLTHTLPRCCPAAVRPPTRRLGPADLPSLPQGSPVR